MERLDLSNLWRLLIQYRLCEGIRNEELDSIAAHVLLSSLQPAPGTVFYSVVPCW